MITTSVNDVLASLERQHNGSHLKTASAADPQPSSVLEEKRAAVDAILAKVANATSEQKTAAAQPNGANGEDAVDGLRKMAAEMEYAEQVATVKQAELFGSALADSYLRRMNEYAESALQAKTASQTPAHSAPPAQQSLRQDQVRTVKEAAATGAANATALVLRMAAEAGGKETLASLQKLAAQQPQTPEPAPTQKAAADDGFDELARLCDHCFNAGFAQITEMINAG